jgi:ABC-type lipoprotein release transport system permease subunit
MMRHVAFVVACGIIGAVLGVLLGALFCMWMEKRKED